MSEPYQGQLMCVGFNFANRGWADCDGQLLPIAQNTALFSLFGTMYGGDGRTTFGLPALRGRTPIHVGTGPGLPTFKQGAKGGATTVVLNDTQIPSHNHLLTGHVKVKVADQRGETHLAGGNPLAKNAVDLQNSGQTIEMYAATATATFADGNELAGLENTLAVANNGGSRDHNNMQPYQVLRWLVALQGLYPSRN